jgi:hypothetical protein
LKCKIFVDQSAISLPVRHEVLIVATGKNDDNSWSIELSNGNPDNVELSQVVFWQIQRINQFHSYTHWVRSGAPEIVRDGFLATAYLAMPDAGELIEHNNFLATKLSTLLEMSRPSFGDFDRIGVGRPREIVFVLKESNNQSLSVASLVTIAAALILFFALLRCRDKRRQFRRKGFGNMAPHV